MEGHMVQGHVHMLIQIPPKYAVSEVIGYIKGKSAIAVARQFSGRKNTTTAKVFGPVAMQCPPLASKKSRSGNISEIRSSLKAKALETTGSFKYH